MLRVLQLGHKAGGYRSPSEGRMALAAAVYGSGGTDREIAALLDETSFELGASWRRRNSRWREQEIVRLRSKAEEYLEREEGTRINNRNDAINAIAKWRGAVESASISGRSASALLALAEGLAVLATIRGGPRFVASFDEIGIESGMSRSSAKRWMDRLQELKLVRRDLVGGGRFAPLWVLTGHGDHKPAPSVSLSCDAARWGGLGKSTVRVARLLSDIPTRPKVLSTQLGIGPEAVRKHLRKLQTADVVSLTPTGWVLTGDVEGTAGDVGTSGMREAQTAALEAKRELRSQELSTWVDENLSK